MLCGKELILATKPFAKEIRSKSWMYVITTILFLALSLAATVHDSFSCSQIIFQCSGRTIHGAYVYHLSRSSASFHSHAFENCKFHYDCVWGFYSFTNQYLEKIP